MTHSSGSRALPSLRPALALALALTGVGQTAAAEPPRLPGLGPEDRRVEVSTAERPWSGLVRVNAVFGPGRRGSCTGALVAPDRVLTAAHCLVGPRGVASPSAVHVLFGYDRGEWRAHSAAATLANAADWAAAPAPERDWALIALATPPDDVAPLPLAAAPPAPGHALALAGYGQDRVHALYADRGCRALAHRAPFVLHDCAGPPGSSGAPLLVEGPEGWAIAGVNVAAGRETNVALGADAFRAALDGS